MYHMILLPHRSQTCRYVQGTIPKYPSCFQIRQISTTRVFTFQVSIPPSCLSVCPCIPDVYVCIIMHMCTIMYYPSVVIEYANASNLLENVLISVPVNFYVHTCIHICTYVQIGSVMWSFLVSLGTLVPNSRD